ncbi:MAG: enoyl-CoA hydratase-related protein [Hydrogenophaga sp.]|uniref:enoyl-CoA hydratase-related protein n=1 Tax=Hydrogenophaga sp. TaxID=1904254 RepID=UPI003D0FC80B
MSEGSVLFEIHDGVAVATLNEGERMNPLSASLQAGLLEVIAHVRTDRSIRALVLTARGRGFCSGADLKDFSQRAAQMAPGDSLGRYVGRMMGETGNPVFHGLRTLPVPVVCAVNGAAAGGGFGLALVGDMVIAARSAFFYLPFVPALGIVPDFAATWLGARTVGRARIAGLMLTGRRLSADKAAEWGLIWDCVDDDRLQEEAMALATQLAALPAHAILEARAMLDAAERNSLEAQLELERQRQAALIDGESFAEGMRAFVERRKPVFRGR